MEKWQSRNKRLGLLAVAAVLMIAMGFVIYAFTMRVQGNEINIAEKNLKVAGDNGVTIVNRTFDRYNAVLSSVAAIVEAEQLQDDASVVKLLTEVARANGYSRLSVDYADGSSHTSDGLIQDVRSLGYLDRIAEGKPFVTDVIDSPTDGRPTVYVLYPLQSAEGGYTAALRLSVRVNEVNKDINLRLFDSQGYYHLVDRNGRYVAEVDSENALLMDQNFFDAIDMLEYQDGYSVQGIIDTFTSGAPAYSRYAVDGNERYTYSQQVGINEWVLMTIVPREAVTRIERQNIAFATRMAVELAAILILGFYLIYRQLRLARSAAELNDRCFRALSSQSGKAIFEWDFVANRIHSMANFARMFGRETVTHSSAEEALEAGMVHDEDREAFEAAFEQVRAGHNINDVRYRVRNAQGEYHWCSLSGVVVLDEHNKPYKAIGTLEDIHERILYEQNMLTRVEHDSLTGLYNKVTTEHRIRKQLESAAHQQLSCALMIIDIDNFKEVNDRMGHQQGDMVLVELAQQMMTVVSAGDIAGRIGGDEFFLFLQGDGEAVIADKAAQLCAMFRRELVSGQRHCYISASIGISRFPTDGFDFVQLYRNADIALYHTKAHGKDGYFFYDGLAGDEYISSRTRIDTEISC